jgi:CBS domain-containing protein
MVAMLVSERRRKAMQLRQIMTQHPSSVQPNDTVQHAAQEMKTHNIGALPVCDGEKLLGIITDRDIAVECVSTGTHPGQCFVKDYMTANPICVPPEATIEEALRKMAEEQVRRLCVVENGALAGIISLGDLAVRMADSLALASNVPSGGVGGDGRRDGRRAP